MNGATDEATNRRKNGEDKGRARELDEELARAWKRLRARPLDLSVLYEDEAGDEAEGGAGDEAGAEERGAAGGS